MKLSKLIEGLDITRVSGDMSCDINSVAYHSKKVEEGCLFVAIKGLQSDGHHFIEEAVKRGAKAIICENQGDKWEGVPSVFVSDTRSALAKVACRFYNYPSKRLKLLGVTGTNGKTTTLYLIESILQEAGIRAGIIGTINYRYGGNRFPSLRTTPESLDLQRIFREMLNERVTHVGLEVSSHGLDLSRLNENKFAVAVFTNLTQDHLDYHKNMENYFQCKSKLFSHFLGGGDRKDRGFGIINLDDSWGKRLLDETEAEIITYGIKNKGEISAKDIDFHSSGISARITTPRGEFLINSPLLGELNLYNILAAVGVSISQQFPLEVIKRGIETAKQVPGRLERVLNDEGILILVDYAHTSDALDRMLSAVKGFTPGRTISVFGCGGDRDRGKRSKMGAVAIKHCDLIIITSDNPRSEDPLKIISEIEEGIKKIRVKKYHPRELVDGFVERGYVAVPDRKKAINLAINFAKTGDQVIIAGKGHEQYQIVGSKILPFDDRAEVRDALLKKEMRKYH